jgi:hypothetical protein
MRYGGSGVLKSDRFEGEKGGEKVTLEKCQKERKKWTKTDWMTLLFVI